MCVRMCVCDSLCGPRTKRTPPTSFLSPLSQSFSSLGFRSHPKSTSVALSQGTENLEMGAKRLASRPTYEICRLSELNKNPIQKSQDRSRGSSLQAAKAGTQG